MLDNITLFDDEDKDWFLFEVDIDEGIKELCDAINSIDCLMTMNSCQGALYEDEAHNHCPKTYVDFYVLDHEYNVANNLFVYLTKEFSEYIECQLEFEADFDLIDDCAEYNGMVNLRYRLEFIEVNRCKEDSKVTMGNVINAIRRYSQDYQV